MIHLPPPEGTKNPSTAEYTPITTGKLSRLAASVKNVCQVLRDACTAVARRCGDNRRDAAVEGKLDQHAAYAGHAATHCIEEHARPPAQQQAEHQEQEVVRVETRDRGAETFRREFVREPGGAERSDENVEPGCVLEPLARASAANGARSLNRIDDSVVARSAGLCRGGAVSQAIVNVTTMRIAVSAQDCHRKIVCSNGITPVIASNAGGMLPGFAWSCAAEDDNPIAHTDPIPR
jgi:hypothetical protein